MIKNNSSFNQWVELNRILKIFKIGLVGLIALNLISWIFVISMTSNTPIIISKENSRVITYKGDKTYPDITDSEVKIFVKEFVSNRYNWEKFNPKHILGNISPLITKGLEAKLRKNLPRQFKELKGKSLQQAIVNLKITIDKNNVTASFDRVLKIDGIALISTSEIAFNIIKGENTWANPLGLYVNGVIEHNEN